LPAPTAPAQRDRPTTPRAASFTATSRFTPIGNWSISFNAPVCFQCDQRIATNGNRNVFIKYMAAERGGDVPSSGLRLAVSCGSLGALLLSAQTTARLNEAEADERRADSTMAHSGG